jgi:hypothetical protein
MFVPSNRLAVLLLKRCAARSRHERSGTSQTARTLGASQAQGLSYCGTAKTSASSVLACPLAKAGIGAAPLVAAAHQSARALRGIVGQTKRLTSRPAQNEQKLFSNSRKILEVAISASKRSGRAYTLEQLRWRVNQPKINSFTSMRLRSLCPGDTSKLVVARDQSQPL